MLCTSVQLSGGQIRDDKTALDAVEAVLPAGTLSGAPKYRAMEIINELEIIREAFMAVQLVILILLEI